MSQRLPPAQEETILRRLQTFVGMETGHQAALDVQYAIDIIRSFPQAPKTVELRVIYQLEGLSRNEDIGWLTLGQSAFFPEPSQFVQKSYAKLRVRKIVQETTVEIEDV